MMLLQLSSGQGPMESCFAVGMAAQRVVRLAATNGIEASEVESVMADKSACFRSVLLKLTGASDVSVKTFAEQWNGSMLWVCPSPFRTNYKRKNWFFGGQAFDLPAIEHDADIEYQTCRASGAGGQHVNTTDSAVRAIHLSSGISVRVECERSQHANKRLATALLLRKLEEQSSQHEAAQAQARWTQHWSLERGNPVKVFKGRTFTLVE